MYYDPMPLHHNTPPATRCSDMYYDPTDGLYWALSDRGPGGGLISYAPRVHKMKISLDGQGGVVQRCGRPPRRGDGARTLEGRADVALHTSWRPALMSRALRHAPLTNTPPPPCCAGKIMGAPEVVKTLIFKVPKGKQVNGVAGPATFNGLNPYQLTGDTSKLGLSFDPEGIVAPRNGPARGKLIVSDEVGPPWRRGLL